MKNFLLALLLLLPGIAFGAALQGDSVQLSGAGTISVSPIQKSPPDTFLYRLSPAMWNIPGGLTVQGGLTATATTAVNFTGTLNGDIQGTQKATSITNGAVTTSKIANSAVGDAQLSQGYLHTNGTNAMTGTLNMGALAVIHVADPQNAQDASTKAYVDAVASGLTVKKSVQYASTTALPSCSYTNNVLTATVVGSLPAQDGYTPVNGDRFLVKDQPTILEYENGIYIVTEAGDRATKWVLTRSSDFNGIPPSGTVNNGAFTFIEGGTAQHSQGWVMITTADPIIIGTTPLSWTQFSEAGVITAGRGLEQVGEAFNVLADGQTITINNSNYLQVINLQGDVTGPPYLTLVGRVGGLSAATIVAGVNAANAATTNGVPNTIVMRDPTGSFIGTASGISFGYATDTPGKTSVYGVGAYAPSSIVQGGNSVFGYAGGVGAPYMIGSSFFGAYAGGQNSTATMSDANVGVGFATLCNVNGAYNTVVGASSGFGLNGSNNSLVGSEIGTGLHGDYNNIFGQYAGASLATGSHTLLLGCFAGSTLTAGTYDIYLGTQSGFPTSESNTMRLGDPTNITSAFLYGMYGLTPSYAPLLSCVGTDGRMGTFASGSTLNYSISGTAQNAVHASYADTAGAFTFGYATGAPTANTGLGQYIMDQNVGSSNSLLGYGALYNNISGYNNTAIGYGTLSNLTTGHNNTAIGLSAGTPAGNHLTIGQDDVYVASDSVSTAESGVIRIGTPFVQTSAYMAGIYSSAATVSSSRLVEVDSLGKLGALASGTTIPYSISGTAASASSIPFGSATFGGNTYFGWYAGYNTSSGTANAGFGRNSLQGITIGNGNTALGDDAGYNLFGTDSNNIDIGHPGQTGENGVIHIGGNFQIASYFAGIYGNTVTTGPQLATVGTDNRLGSIAYTPNNVASTIMSRDPQGATAVTTLIVSGAVQASSGTLILSGQQGSNPGASVTIGGLQPRTATSGTAQDLYCQNTFAPTSGNCAWSSLKLQSTINQTGGANGVSRDVFVIPTITSAFDYRSIETDTNVSNVTSAARGFYSINTFVPTSANTVTYTSIDLSSTINQSSGATGITRGLGISPNLSFVYDYRPIDYTQSGSSLFVVKKSGAEGINVNPGSMLGDLDIRQIANGDDVHYSRRNTDSSPTGNFINFQNNTGNTTLFSVDVKGAVVAAGSVTTPQVVTPLVSASVGLTLTSSLGSTPGAAFNLQDTSILTSSLGDQYLELRSATFSGTGTVNYASVASNVTYNTTSTGTCRGLLGNPTIVAAATYHGVEQSGNLSNVTSAARAFYASPTFAPVGGTAGYAAFRDNSNINQTGGASGKTYGLYLNPTITSASSYTAISAMSNKFSVDQNGNLATINSVSYNWPSTVGPPLISGLANDGNGNLTWAVNTQVHAYTSTVILSNGGAPIVAGLQSNNTIIYNYGTIRAWTISSSSPGSCQIDVWKVNSATPTIANSIVGATPPTLSSASFATSTNVGAWSTAMSANDIMVFYVTSASGVSNVTVTIVYY